MKKAIQTIFLFSLTLLGHCSLSEKDSAQQSEPFQAIGYIQPSDTLLVKTEEIIAFREDTLKKTYTQGRTVKARKPKVRPFRLAPKQGLTVKTSSFSPELVTIITPGQNGIPPPKRYMIPEEGFRIQNGDSIFAPQTQLAKMPKPVAASPMLLKDQSNYTIKVLDVDQGLSSSYIYLTYEDSRGHLWIGTYAGGVCRYDGSSITTFSKNEGLINNTVKAIFEDSKGNIWFGTNGGLSKYDGRSFTNFTPKEGLSGTVVRVIVEDDHGHLWLGTNSGICKYDGQSFTHYREAQGLSGDDIWSLILDKKGRIWSNSYNAGVSCFDGNSFYRYHQLDVFSKKSSGTLWEDKWENIWIGTSGILMSMNETIITEYLSPSFSNVSLFWSFAEDQKDNLWLGTTSGIIKFDGEKVIQITSHEGLTNDNIRCVTTDHSGNLWLSSYGGGVMKFAPDAFVNYSEQEGLMSSFVFGIAEDQNHHLWFASRAGVERFDGKHFFSYSIPEGNLGGWTTDIMQDSNHNLWFASTNEGATKFDGENFTYFFADAGLPNNVAVVFEDSKGNIWIGTERNGLYKYDGKAIIAYNELHEILGGFINSIFESSKGQLWVCSSLGLGIIDQQQLRVYTQKNGLPNNYISKAIEDQNGNIWLGMEEGLCKLVASGSSTDWSASLYYYNVEGGLSNNLVQSLIEDPYGNIWVGTERGLNRLKPSEGHPKDIYQLQTFLGADGLKGLDIWSNSVHIDTANRIWWGTGKGLTHFDINALDSAKHPIIPELTHIEIEQQHVDFNRLSEPEYASATTFHKQLRKAVAGTLPFSNIPEKLNLPHRLNHLTFHFNAKTWSGRHKLRYSYRMKGLPGTWSLPSDENKADYKNLPTGTYTFELMAIGENGVWSSPINFSFSVRPPWWETQWAYLSYLLLGIFLFWTILRLYTRQLRQRQKILEQKVEERTEEINRQKEEIEEQAEELILKNEQLKELDHFKQELTGMIVHDLKNPLNSILGFAESLNLQSQGKKILQAGNSMLSLVMNILDVQKFEEAKMELHLEVFKLRDFIDLAIDRVSLLKEEKNIQFHVNTAQESFIKADKELIIRVLENILSNAIKFTPVNKNVHIYNMQAEKEGWIKIVVEDEGPGIPKDQVDTIFTKFSQIEQKRTGRVGSTGLGLTFCKLAIEAHGGSIGAISSENKGASIWFSLPITKEAPTTALTSSAMADTADPMAQKEMEFATISQEEKEWFFSLVHSIDRYKVFQITEVLDLLKEIPDDASPAIQHWKSKVEQSIYTSNEKRFDELVKKVLSQKS